MASPANLEPLYLRALLGGQPQLLRGWLDRGRVGSFSASVAVIFVGAGLYGAAMGCWRAPLQAFFVALKFPLIILLTSAGNAVLNATLAPLLGLNITFRQSFLAILMSFTIASAILGSFSPLAAYLVWNSPPLSTDVALSSGTYSLIQVTHVATIAFAGVVANLHLGRMLREISGCTAVARRVLLAWLAGNLFLGSQLTWILRPFIGSPTLPVEFLRATAFKGNFYETVFRATARMVHLD